MSYSITSTNYGIYLHDPATQNPATVVAGAYVTYLNGGNAIFGNDNAAWDVTNFGTVKTTGSTGSGIYLSNNGVVGNAANAIINGAIYGVYIGGAAGTNTVNNAANSQIGGGVAGLHLSGAIASVANAGTISGTGADGLGAVLNPGTGFLTNSAGGLIRGVSRGVTIGSTLAVVANFGTLQATGASGSAVYLSSNKGYVTNNTGGSILGVRYGIDLDGDIATVTNSGTISATGASGDGITSHGTSAQVFNLASGSISGYVRGAFLQSDSISISNSGAISGTGAASSGVYLGAEGGHLTNNLGGRVFGVLYGVNVQAGLGMVSNSGTISGTGTASTGIVIESGGGYVTNQAGGMVSGARYGVKVNSDLGNVVNSGTVVTRMNGIGIYLAAGNVTNTSSGTIVASGALATAVVVTNGTFFNSGVVQGQVFGVELSSGKGTAGRTVTLTGTVTGAVGVGVSAGSTATQTVSVSGLVVGTSGTAVALTTGGSDRLILHAGASFQGKVSGGGGKSVVEVSAASGALSGGAAETAAAAGYVSLGSVSNFSALQVDSGAATDADGNLTFDTLVNQGQINLLAGDSLVVGTVAGAATGGTIDLKSGGSVHFTGAVAAGQTVLFRPPGGSVVLDHPEQFAAAITQFAATDLIDLPLGTASFQQYAGGVLSLNYGGGTVALQLATIYATPQFQFTGDGHGGTDILVSDAVCFCRGTMILAERGEVAVEDLAVGERVRTLSGALKPIVWIGTGSAPVGRGNRLARPVIVRRGALAEGVPSRDLYLTHGHALYLDSAIGGVLIPVENLVNHHSILWDESAESVEYYHIELEEHDVLLANGAPAESYYDASNRAQFDNIRPGSAPGEATSGFAPVLSGGEIVELVWAALLARAGGRPPSGPQGDTTDDPDLHLMVNGARLDPPAVDGTTYRFTLAAPPAGPLALRSRSGVPSLLGITAHDHRRLGVAISRIVYGQRGVTTTLLFNAPILQQGGCHPPEATFSWTDGDLELPARLFAHLRGPFTLTVHTERPGGMRYPLAGEGRQAA